MRKARLGKALAAVGLVLLLAGCTTAPGVVPTADVAEDATIKLADLMACAFEYPDGSSVPCGQKSRVIDVSGGSPPANWLCIASTDDSLPKHVSLYRDASSSRVGMRYAAPDLVDGVSILVQVEGSSALSYAPAGPVQGWVDLGTLPGRGELTATLYHVAFRSPTPALQGATIEQRWSLFEGRPWPVHAITADGVTYYVQRIVRTPEQNNLIPFDIVGADFEMHGDHQLSMRATLEYGIAPAACQ